VWGGMTCDLRGAASAGFTVKADGVVAPMGSSGAPPERVSHSAVWTPAGLIVWGGVANQRFLDSGAIYDPAHDSWHPITNVHAPAARGGHVAVWTGRRMLVWGGSGGDFVASTPLYDGGAYDPFTNSWTPLAAAGAPNPGPAAYPAWIGFWTGDHLGLLDPASLPAGPAFYDPLADSWSSMGATGGPEAGAAATVWTGSSLLVWGGVVSDAVTNAGFVAR
ncbi:MAG: Kelch repeat-containing protein, partial [Myxococcales bacterium]